MKHWQTEPAEPQLALMREILQSLSQKPASNRPELARAIHDRAVMTQGIDAPELKARIARLLQSNADVLKLLRKVKPLEMKTEGTLTPFPEYFKFGRELPTLLNLAVLETLVEATEGDLERASVTLFGAFAFAENGLRSQGRGNQFLSLIVANGLLEVIFDLQSAGFGDLSPILRMLDANAPTNPELGTLRWKSLCYEIPLLIDKPRNKSDWESDLKMTFQRLGQTLPDNLRVEPEEVGRQLQTMALTSRNVQRLYPRIVYKHGGIEAVNRQAESGDVRPLQLTISAAVPTLIKYIDKILEEPGALERLKHYREQIAFLVSVERLRSVAAIKGAWPKEVGTELTENMRTRSMGFPPVVDVESECQVPSYTIRLPALTKEWKSMFVQAIGEPK